jgi:Carboxypeptidase regulatory-like domain
MRSAKVFLALLSVLSVTFLTQKAVAQNVYAAVHGTVTDSTGAVVANATVEILNTSTNISSKVTTDNKGNYRFQQLQIGGPYTITIQAQNFQQFKSTGLTLNLNDDRAVDAVLQVGSGATTVQVQAATVQVETSDTQLKTELTSQDINSLPSISRDVSQLEKTAPGVVEAADRFGTFSANGSQTTTNSFLLDGTDINDAPLQTQGITVNPDAISELNIIVSTLNPEFSRNSGAILNEVTKSGTNSFHGNGFEYYRDTFLNNGDYFSLPGQRPPFHQNLYGGTLGGPVLKDKLFFFVAYQGYRNRTGGTQNTPVFSPDQVSGNFGDAGALSTNPIPYSINGCVADGNNTWASCFPNGLSVSPSQFDPVAGNLLNKFVPAANTTIDGTPYYSFSTANSGGGDQGVIRADFHLSQNDEIWSSAVFESDPSMETLPFTGATLPGFAEVDAAHVKIFNASYTHVFNTSTLNEFRVAYFRFNYAAVEPATPVAPSAYGFQITPQNTAAQSVPLLPVAGYFTLGFSNNGPQPRKDSNLSFVDNFSKTIGAHSTKFGAHITQYRVSNPFYFDNNGAYSFEGGGPYSSGDPAIDFTLGVPDSYGQFSGGFIDAGAYETYLYAQDNWKMSPSFTFNYGLGWDAEEPFQNSQFGGVAVTCFVGGSAQSKVYPTAPAGLLYPGDPGCNKAGGPTIKYKHFAPRIGFAWSPDSGPTFLTGGHQDFVVRAGFGLYYNRDQEEGSLQNLETPPFTLFSQGASSVGLQPGLANPFADVAGRGAGTNPYPFTPPKPGQPVDFIAGGYFPAELNNFDVHNTVPVVYNFNLNIQRSLPGEMVMTLGYVGSLGHHLVTTYDANPMTSAGHAACLADPDCIANRSIQRLIYPSHATDPLEIDDSGLGYYLGVGTQATLGNSNYNSFQAQLQKAQTHGLSFTLAYTYSHGLDNASGLESSGFNGLGTNYIPGFGYLSYGDSDYDARHRFVGTYVYEIPILQSMKDNFIMREFLGGWHVSGVTALQKGFPITILDTGGYNSLWCDGFNYYSCPDTAVTSTFKIKTLNPRSGQWFDPSVFSQEPIGTFGNVKRNFFHGPGFNYTNLGIYKDFPLGAEKSRYIEIRLDSFNTFNHPNFAPPGSPGVPGANFGAGTSPLATFGTISSVIQPSNFGGSSTDPQPGRAVQLAGKIYF